MRAKAAATTARVPLTPDRIVDAALEVADAEGIDAVTMRRLAEVLGVHPTSIYNHLSSKEAILDALADRLMSEASLPVRFAGWQEWIRTFALAMREVARAHPGAFKVFTMRPAMGPVASEHTEAALDAFLRAGFSPRRAREILVGIGLAVLGMCLNECPPIHPVIAPDVTHLSPERFPRIFEATAEADADSTGVWETMIDAIVAGLS